MARFLRQNWLWLLWITGMTLPFAVRPTSQLMAGIEILPGLVAIILLVVRKHKMTMAEIKRRRGDA